MYRLYSLIAVLTAAFENPYADQEYQVDTKLALHAFSSIQSATGIILGVLCVIVCMLVSITTVTDILFLTIPGIHEIITEAINKRRREGKSSSKLVIMSKQAIDAWAEANENGTNVYVVYLRRRGLFYILVAIAVFFMVTGWSQVVTLVAKIIYNILYALKLV